MRRLSATIASLALMAGISPAMPQSITLQGVARAYSASYFMRTVCPKFFAVNNEFSTKHAGSLLEFGSTQFGRNEAKAAITVEMERRRKEVEITGKSAWCGYQRASMMADGLRDLFR
jgi:hypothetical protein